MTRDVTRCCGYAFLVILLLLLSACSTSNRGTVSEPVRDASSSFAVEALGIAGTYAPVLSVTEGAAGVAVTVRAVGAEGMTEALLHVHYDAGQYTPERVDFGTYLGGENQVVTLALTDQRDVVPIGIVQIGSALVAPRSGDGDLATVHFRAEPFSGTRRASGVPMEAYNAVDDLKIIGQQAGTATLWWTHRNVGDFNNDSEVGVPDLTPIGVYYEQEVEKSSDPARVGLADGNKDGWITVADITQIGANFGNRCSGYKLYTDAAGTAEYSSGMTVDRSDFADEPIHPIEYTYIANVPIGFTQFTVRPMEEEGSPVGPVSIAAEVVDEDGPPDPPSNVVATSNSLTGHQTVQLTWSPSLSPDVSKYVIERKLVSDGVWGAPVEVSGLTSYMDTDSSFLEQPYEYRLHAKDFGGAVSTYAFSNEVTPYFVEGPPPPQNVVTDNQLLVPNAIEVRWEAPGDDGMVTQYEIFCKVQGESEFSSIAVKGKGYRDHLHTGLTPGWYYEYYVVSLGVEADSEPSNVSGNTPSVYVPEIHILSLTTDKTTHCSSASEAAANLVVTTDETADSVDWSATGGTATGDGTTATWAPTSGMDAVKVTVTCTVHKGTAEDTATIDLYVTDASILTQYGETGHFIDFSLDCLEAIELSGDVIPARPFTHYADGEHVVVFDRWESG